MALKKKKQKPKSVVLMFFHRYFRFEGESSGIGYSAFSALNLLTRLMERWALLATHRTKSRLQVRSLSQYHALVRETFSALKIVRPQGMMNQRLILIS